MLVSFHGTRTCKEALHWVLEQSHGDLVGLVTCDAVARIGVCVTFEAGRSTRLELSYATE